MDRNQQQKRDTIAEGVQWSLTGVGHRPSREPGTGAGYRGQAPGALLVLEAELGDWEGSLQRGLRSAWPIFPVPEDNGILDWADFPRKRGSRHMDFSNLNRGEETGDGSVLFLSPKW